MIHKNHFQDELMLIIIKLHIHNNKLNSDQMAYSVIQKYTGNHLLSSRIMHAKTCLIMYLSLIHSHAYKNLKLKGYEFVMRY